MRRSASIASALFLLVFSAPATAVTLGYVESWPDSGNLAQWRGGVAYANPGHDGVGGPADGFLSVKTTAPGNLGTRSGDLSQYPGDWVAAGITHIDLWLNDIGAADGLEIHVALGANSNRWSYNVGFVPPNGAWAPFSVDLTDAGLWTQIITPIGGGTIQQALQSVQVVNVRHDVAPFMQDPDNKVGDFGLDELVLSAETGVPQHGPAAGGRPVLVRAPSPNPGPGPFTISFRTFDDGPVRARVIDASGRLVRTEELGAAPAGDRSWTWDGAGDSGRRVAAGVYRVQVEGAAGGTSRPLVLVR